MFGVSDHPCVIYTHARCPSKCLQLHLQGAEIEHVLKSVMRKQVMAGQQAVQDLVFIPQPPRPVPS